MLWMILMTSELWYEYLQDDINSLNALITHTRLSMI